MSTLSVRSIIGKDGSPVSFPNGINIGSGASGGINDIGVAGNAGFGVGVCPTVPSGFAALPGCYDPLSENYGNYQYTDGSVMVWVPAFYYKWGTGSNGLAINAVDIKPLSAYATVAEANAEPNGGYALHRAFYNAGAVQPGVFVDKYQCSNNSGTASSIKNGNPLSSSTLHNPFSGLTGAPANAYYGAIDAAKTRGSQFFCNSRFIFSALAMLSYAHGQAAAGVTYCAWYDDAGVTNYPKGNNNDALRDANDGDILYAGDGYSNCGKTGSANLFARTTHNGQVCGIADLNGNMWEINLGLVRDSSGTSFYALKTTTDIATLTSGQNDGAGNATDAWGSTAHLDTLYDSITLSHITDLANWERFGNGSNQVLSGSTSGDGWSQTGLGIYTDGGSSVGGLNSFGTDGIYEKHTTNLCPISGGAWNGGSSAGVWTLYLNDPRAGSGVNVGFRVAAYV